MKWLAPMLAALLLLLPALARAQGGAAPRWTLDFTYWHALEQDGHIQVRENAAAGTRLHLGDDLGLKRWDTYSLELGYRRDNGDRLRLGAFTSQFQGSAHVDDPFTFNGATYAGGQSVSLDKTSLDRFWMLYEYRLGPGRGEGGPYLLLGLFSDNLDFHIDGDLDPATERTEKRENFARQLFIWPTLGLGSRGRIAPSVELYGEAYGFLVNGMTSQYNEGGRMVVSQAAFDAVAGLRWVDVPLRPALAYRYRYFSQLTRSHEDRNDALIRAHGPELSLQVRF